jgi:hypothetical protein
MIYLIVNTSVSTTTWDKRFGAAEKTRLHRLLKYCSTFFVIPSEARNLSFFCWAETKQRFLASLGMIK